MIKFDRDGFSRSMGNVADTSIIERIVDYSKPDGYKGFMKLANIFGVPLENVLDFCDMEFDIAVIGNLESYFDLDSFICLYNDSIMRIDLFRNYLLHKLGGNYNRGILRVLSDRLMRVAEACNISFEDIFKYAKDSGVRHEGGKACMSGNEFTYNGVLSRIGLKYDLDGLCEECRHKVTERVLRHEFMYMYLSCGLYEEYEGFMQLFWISPKVFFKHFKSEDDKAAFEVDKKFNLGVAGEYFALEMFAFDHRHIIKDKDVMFNVLNMCFKSGKMVSREIGWEDEFIRDLSGILRVSQCDVQNYFK